MGNHADNTSGASGPKDTLIARMRSLLLFANSNPPSWDAGETADEAAGLLHQLIGMALYCLPEAHQADFDADEELLARHHQARAAARAKRDEFRRQLNIQESDLRSLAEELAQLEAIAKLESVRDDIGGGLADRAAYLEALRARASCAVSDQKAVDELVSRADEALETLRDFLATEWRAQTEAVEGDDKRFFGEVGS